MEATMFTGWVYDHLMKHSPQVKVAHPTMLKAISAGKKKNDRVDAQKISDFLRGNYFPESYLASLEIRDRRRFLRPRNLLVRQSIQMVMVEAPETANECLVLHHAGITTEKPITPHNNDLDRKL